MYQNTFKILIYTTTVLTHRYVLNFGTAVPVKNAISKRTEKLFYMFMRDPEYVEYSFYFTDM